MTSTVMDPAVAELARGIPDSGCIVRFPYIDLDSQAAARAGDRMTGIFLRDMPLSTALAEITMHARQTSPDFANLLDVAGEAARRVLSNVSRNNCTIGMLAASAALLEVGAPKEVLTGLTDEGVTEFRSRMGVPSGWRDALRAANGGQYLRTLPRFTSLVEREKTRRRDTVQFDPRTGLGRYGRHQALAAAAVLLNAAGCKI